MSNEQGQSTNALYGFIRSIEKLQKDFSVEHIAIVFDGKENSKSRKELYPEYKANRQAAPEDLPEQMQWAEEYCRHKGLAIIKEPFVEADDSIASIATWAAEVESDVFICSSDKDLCQVVSDRIRLLHTHKDNFIVDRKKVFELHGVYPEQIVDYLAIVGDSSDNIPGIDGFGPKTAAKLLGEFQTLDQILQNIEQIKGQKKQEQIRSSIEKALLSRKLAETKKDLEIPKNSCFYQIKDGQKEALYQFYEKFSFHSLLKELREKNKGPEISAKEPLNYQCIEDEQTLISVLDLLQKADMICFDTETDSIKALEAKIVGIAFAIEKGTAYYLPANGKVPFESCIKHLKIFFENPKNTFYGHNVKYDLHVLSNLGIKVAKICFDTILASYLLHADEHRHSLQHLSKKYFGKDKTEYRSLFEKGQKSLLEVPVEKVKNYCCEDVDDCLRLKEVLEQELQDRKISHLLSGMELPLLRILEKMEQNGIFVDANILTKLSSDMKEKVAKIEKEIFSLAGEEFNIHSTKQLSSILFDKLKLPPSHKTQSAYSTNAQVLEKLASEHPIAEKILEFRSLEKLRSTYTDSLIKEIHPQSQRIHCSFRQSVTATGRLSCQNPNLQNIPVRSPEGLEIRAAFMPQKKGWSYLSADYSQIELRLLAHMSEDPTLVKAFQNGEDIHKETAASIFSVPKDQVSYQQRAQAKAVNFGILYGQSAFGLAKELKIAVNEAAFIIRSYFDRFPKVNEFIEKTTEKARAKGFSTTFTGRERIIHDMNSKNQHIRAAAERLAVNTPLQGSAADLIKLAMLKCQEKIKDKLGFMILQIHDELIFEVPDFELLDFEHIVRQCMEKVFLLKVPLTVNISVGKNWKEC